MIKYSNNNNKLLAIIDDLQQIKNYSKDHIIINWIADIIHKMNNIKNFLLMEIKKLEN